MREVKIKIGIVNQGSGAIENSASEMWILGEALLSYLTIRPERPSERAREYTSVSNREAQSAASRLSRDR